MFWAAARPLAQARGVECAKRAPRAIAMLWERPAFRSVALVVTFFTPVATRSALMSAVMALSSAGERVAAHEGAAVAPVAPRRPTAMPARPAPKERRNLGPRIGRSSRLLAG